MNAETKVRHSIRGQLSRDGYTISFDTDDSLGSWWAIVRWNAHFGHWRLVFLTNLPDLFRKVVRRKLSRGAK